MSTRLAPLPPSGCAALVATSLRGTFEECGRPALVHEYSRFCREHEKTVLFWCDACERNIPNEYGRCPFCGFAYPEDPAAKPVDVDQLWLFP